MAECKPRRKCSKLKMALFKRIFTGKSTQKTEQSPDQSPGLASNMLYDCEQDEELVAQESDRGLYEAKVLYDFDADEDDELTVHEGDFVTVTDEEIGNGWLKARDGSGNTGLVPEAYVEVTEGLESDDRDQSDGWKDYADNTTGSQCWPATDHEKSASEEKVRADKAYSLASKEGNTSSSSSVSIYILGQEHAGKTSLISTLLGDKFEEHTAAVGAEADVCTFFAANWCRIEKSAVPKKLQKLYDHSVKGATKIKICTMQFASLSTATSKQELQQSVPLLPAVAKVDVDQAITLVPNDGIDAVIWDFSGRSVYHGLHSMFLKEDNVAMIVFDASKDLYDPRDVIKDPYTENSINPSTTGAETVSYWLKSIHSICHKDGREQGSKSNLVPVVFLIATHIDTIGDEKAIEEKKKQIIEFLCKLLIGKPYAQHLAGIGKGLRCALEKYCFFISNRIREPKALDRIKSKVIKASQYILNRQHPVVFLIIEKELIATNKPVITIADFHAIANKCGFFADIDSEEFKGALAHFHNKGTILHFPHTELLKAVVVLSPQWLTKLVAYIIVAHQYKVDGSRHDKQFQRLQDHGILVEDFINCMVNKFNKGQNTFGFPVTTERATAFVKQFGLIAEINSTTHFLEEEWQPPATEDKAYIVPHMLPWKLPVSATVAKAPADSDKNACIVYFKFPKEFISLMVFYQTFATCIDRNTQRHEDLCLLRRHLIKLVLGSDQYYYVTLSEEKDSIRLAITPDEDGIVSITGLQERWKLIEFFQAKLWQITTKFMPASDVPESYIPCSLCPILHLKLDEIRTNKNPLRCSRGKLPANYYKHLRQYPESSEAIDSETTTSGNGNLPPELAIREPNLKKMVQYLKVLTEWECFGVYLLPVEESYYIKQIKRENHSISDCKWALYKKYIDTGVRTWQTVINALKASDHTNLAKEVTKELIKDLNTSY